METDNSSLTGIVKSLVCGGGGGSAGRRRWRHRRPGGTPGDALRVTHQRRYSAGRRRRGR